MALQEKFRVLPSVNDAHAVLLMQAAEDWLGFSICIACIWFFYLHEVTGLHFDGMTIQNSICYYGEGVKKVANC